MEITSDFWEKIREFVKNGPEGLVCVEKETPPDIMKEIREVNEERQKFYHADFIKII